MTFNIFLGINSDNCDKCSAKFANNVNHEHVIVDRGTWKSFCCAECVYAHVRDDTQMVVCCMCQHRQRFYNCIRRNCDDRRFCSVNCAIAAETGIEQLMQNDERCHSEYLSLIRTPFESDSESESNDSFEGEYHTNNRVTNCKSFNCPILYRLCFVWWNDNRNGSGFRQFRFWCSERIVQQQNRGGDSFQ